MALTPTDRLLLGYIGIVTAVIVLRGTFAAPGHAGILVAHGLLVVLLWLFTRPRAEGPFGRTIHAFYPVLMLMAFYASIGLINDTVGLPRILENDAVVQRWEAALFGGQVSYTWIRDAPSVFWSGLLHFSYFLYYPIVLGGPAVVAHRAGLAGVHRVVFATMLAFVLCYVTFVIFPVAGPNYVFPHPTGPVREVWSAKLVYGVLAGGSSVGAAFPSSHVAAPVAAVWAIWRVWPALARTFAVPTALLTVATVYCQMHYAVDALAGLAVGLAAGAAAQWLWLWSSAAGVVSPVESPLITANAPRTSRR